MYPTDKNSLYHKRVENLLGAKNIESVDKKIKKAVYETYWTWLKNVFSQKIEQQMFHFAMELNKRWLYTCFGTMDKFNSWMLGII